VQKKRLGIWYRTGFMLTNRLFVSSFKLLLATLGTLLIVLAISNSVYAGPPFRTDDPETVEYRNGEFYVAHAYSNDRGGVSGTAPHLETNFGIVPNVQLHLTIPMAFSRPNGEATLYGPGDVELGVKYRFVQEAENRPMVGTFPIVHLPTGNSDRGLGNGSAQVFLPLWLQKAWGPWQTYGGGGYWINPGTDNQNFWFFGWQVQREVNKRLTIGAEIFNQTPAVKDGSYETGYNIGTMINFTENHHFIFSGGTDIWGQNLFSYYAAYLWTWGPSEK